MDFAKLNVELIKKARTVLSKYIAPSPLLQNSWLSEQFGCEVFLKLETMQPIGSFKIRGATFKISQIAQTVSKEEFAKGVIAASAGNHAQGVAWGAKTLGTKALIVMPKNASLIKAQNTKSLGAEIVFEGETYDEAYAHALKLAQETKKEFVHAFKDPDVIAGQGTLALEVLDQLPDLDCIIGSIGGGGLMSGVSLAMKALKPSVQVIGCQAKGAPSMVESIQRGAVVRSEKVNTFADGIAVQEASEEMRKVLAKNVDEFYTADDEEIAGAVLTLMEKAKIVSEGSGAVPLAILEEIKSQVKGKKVVLIVSGGNIDVNLTARIIDRGLIRAGRRLRINVLISDRPGSLSILTALIAKEGANILQAVHDRDEPSVRIDQTAVALTLETKGHEHCNKVIRALEKTVDRINVFK
jgi:threonine dehydratase